MPRRAQPASLPPSNDSITISQFLTQITEEAGRAAGLILLKRPPKSDCLGYLRELGSCTITELQRRAGKAVKPRDCAAPGNLSKLHMDEIKNIPLLTCSVAGCCYIVSRGTSASRHLVTHGADLDSSIDTFYEVRLVKELVKDPRDLKFFEKETRKANGRKNAPLPAFELETTRSNQQASSSAQIPEYALFGNSLDDNAQGTNVRDTDNQTFPAVHGGDSGQPDGLLDNYFDWSAAGSDDRATGYTDGCMFTESYASNLGGNQGHGTVFSHEVAQVPMPYAPQPVPRYAMDGVENLDMGQAFDQDWSYRSSLWGDDICKGVTLSPPSSAGGLTFEDYGFGSFSSAGPSESTPISPAFTDARPSSSANRRLSLQREGSGNQLH
ncbi:hypothetical protein K488DRAFT_82926 [Vararia minispora EC-137]|uniref:Uncharacterized protein n=1 Tax=Vararia minispora EC-137 TaxID=1314806 RepID=A0ACB8QVN5_9AGAM|nr:hypothetical protein K488DRAFT_82926 [Vararia minispora EC-137]